MHAIAVNHISASLRQSIKTDAMTSSGDSVSFMLPMRNSFFKPRKFFSTSHNETTTTTHTGVLHVEIATHNCILKVQRNCSHSIVDQNEQNLVSAAFDSFRTHIIEGFHIEAFRDAYRPHDNALEVVEPLLHLHTHNRMRNETCLNTSNSL